MLALVKKDLQELTVIRHHVLLTLVIMAESVLSKVEISKLLHVLIIIINYYEKNIQPSRPFKEFEQVYENSYIIA
jgi:hypothetical protein